MSQIIKYIAQHVLVRQWRAAGLGRGFAIMILILLVSGVHSFVTRPMGGTRITTVGEVTRVAPIQGTRQPKAVVSYEFQVKSGKRYAGSSVRTLGNADDVVVGDKITVKYRRGNARRSWIVALQPPAPLQAPAAGTEHRSASKYWSQLNKPKVGSDSGTPVLGYLLYGGIIAFFFYRIFVSPLLRLINFLTRMRRKNDAAAELPVATSAGQQEAALTDVADAITSYGRRAATLTGPARTKPMPDSMPWSLQGGTLGGGLESASPRSTSLPSAARNDSRYKSEQSRYKTRPAQAAFSRRKRTVKTRAGWFG